VKRSEVNAILEGSIDFFSRMNFLLPPFAHWSPDDWRARGPECAEIARLGLGWDITDFGRGRFDEFGLVLFTLRNGELGGETGHAAKPYAEKIMIAREGQLTPNHFHFVKMEDIINRGGGELMIQLWNSDENEDPSDSDVTVSLDGVETTVAAGTTVALKPGESICLVQGIYHAFWACEGKGDVMIGEVSQINNDHTDNRFHETIGRFAEIEEDQPPLHLLCNEYGKYYRHC
jgi:D-lyxose ketol-isomerase